jgi:phosphoenolpyruvate synthase/pyruvate phosphate dikinase
MKQYSHPHPLFKNFFAGVVNSRNNICDWSYFVQDLEKQARQYLDLFLHDRKHIDNIEQHINRSREQAVRTLKRTRFAELTDKDLADALDRFFTDLTQLLFSTAHFRGLDISLQHYLEQMLGKRANVPDGALALLSVPDREAANVLEEKALLELAAKLKQMRIALDSPEALRMIQDVHAKFCWVTLGYYTEKARTVEEYTALVAALVQKDPAQQPREHEQKQHKDFEKRDALIKQLKLNEEEAYCVKLAQSSVYLKDNNKAAMNEVLYYAEPLWEEIARRLQKSPDYVKHYFHEEISRALLGKKAPDEKIIAERKRHLIIAVNEGILEIYEGKNADAFEAKYLAKISSEGNEFKGRIACKGKGTGTVKVIVGSFDFGKMNDGDILVVGNTTPDYVRIMKKAAAIVAEEGGLTAHVSVVSREFGIPCVVGVNNITRILKDGDKVEVDAEKGIVRKL